MLHMKIWWKPAITYQASIPKMITERIQPIRSVFVCS